jgi:replicative DNA helicase
MKSSTDDGSELFAGLRDTEAERRIGEYDERAIPLHLLLPEAQQLAEDRRAGRIRPVPVPWSSLGEALGGGLWPGMHVLTGPTGTGKSQLAVQLAAHAAREDFPVLYIALELSRADVVFRVLGSELADKYGEDAPKWSDLAFGRAPEKLDEAVRLVKNFTEWPFDVEEGEPFRWHAGTLRERAMALRQMLKDTRSKAASRPMLIVVDYLQIIGAPPPLRGERVPDLREKIAQAAYAARSLARDPEVNAAVVLLSSVARNAHDAIAKEAEARTLGTGDAGRFVGQGKESGEIEFGADSVLALCPEGQDSHSPGTRTMHLAIAKLRHGKGGWVKLLFNGAWFKEANPVGRRLE